MSPDTDRLRRDAIAVAATHATLALVYWLALGVSIEHDFGPDVWGWFYQNLETDLLLEHPLQSIWALHAQPPLWNVVGAIYLHLFGSLQLPMLHLTHIGLGAAVAAMALLVVGRATGSRRVALAVGLLVALHPALFLYEAYALYTTFVTFLVTLAAYLLSGAERSDAAPWGPVWFLVAISALTLTRSVYHLVYLLALTPLAVALVGRPTRRQWIVMVFALLLPVGWYAKNKVQYGFFGASSWYGMGLWRTALFRQNSDVLLELRDEGLIETVARLEAFTPPVAYRGLGFEEESDVPALSRNDNHNINIPEISAAYQRSAVSLIKRSPRQYVRNVVTAYGNFATPSSDFVHLTANRERIRWHAELDRWLLGRPLVARTEAELGGEAYYGSLYYLLFPAVLFLYAFQFTRNLDRPRDLMLRPLDDPPLFFIAFTIVYTLVISCSMELGENIRFKFPVEPVFLVLGVVVLHRMFGAREGETSSTDSLPPG